MASTRFLVLGLTACVGVSVLVSTCPAQEGMRPPVAPAAARERAVQIDGVMISYLPNRADVRLSDPGSSTYRRGSWMRIMVQFTSQPPWADEIRFDCYVLLRDSNQERLLTGSVTCEYVQAGRQHYVCLFVPPNAVERYGGRFGAIAIESYYQNSLVSDYTFPRTARKWWQDYTGVPGAMVTWFYTPFLRDGISRYEQVKVGGQGL